MEKLEEEMQVVWVDETQDGDSSREEEAIKEDKVTKDIQISHRRNMENYFNSVMDSSGHTVETNLEESSEDDGEDDVLGLDDVYVQCEKKPLSQTSSKD